MKTITIDLTEDDINILQDVIYNEQSVEWVFETDDLDEQERILVRFVPYQGE